MSVGAEVKKKEKLAGRELLYAEGNQERRGEEEEGRDGGMEGWSGAEVKEGKMK